MDKEKLDRLIASVADISGLTPNTASLVAIKGENMAAVAVFGDPDEIIDMLRQGMKRDHRLKSILIQAVFPDIVHQNGDYNAN